MTDTIEKEAFYHFLELLPIQNRSMDEILPPEEQENWPIFQAAFQAARLAERREILSWMEDWCGINAYDADRGPCDEHTVDDCRGLNCSAEDLLDALKKKLEADK